jgi:hypothetical protein
MVKVGLYFKKKALIGVFNINNYFMIYLLILLYTKHAEIILCCMQVA